MTPELKAYVIEMVMSIGTEISKTEDILKKVEEEGDIAGVEFLKDCMMELKYLRWQMLELSRKPITKGE